MQNSYKSLAVNRIPLWGIAGSVLSVWFTPARWLSYGEFIYHIFMKYHQLVAIFIVAVSLSKIACATASNTECLMCHSARSLAKSADGKRVSLYIDSRYFSASVHGKNACVDCHKDLKKQPLAHKPRTAPVECTECHRMSHLDTIHTSVGNGKSPTCSDCHGSHYISPVSSSTSSVGPIHSESTCARCHYDEKAIAVYLNSIHAQPNKKVKGRVASCTDCHQSHTSRLANAPEVCSYCHSQEFRAFSQSSHGRAVLRGNPDAPTCVACHGAHDIVAVSNIHSPVYPSNIATTCSKCHEDAALATRNSLPTDRLKTYLRSYHGAAILHGNISAATCTNCHGSHEIRGSDDPKSSTHRDNLPDTCRKCHPNANPKWAEGTVHVVVSGSRKDAVYYVSTGFKWLTISVMTALIGHIMLDLFSQLRRWLQSRLWKDTK